MNRLYRLARVAGMLAGILPILLCLAFSARGEDAVSVRVGEKIFRKAVQERRTTVIDGWVAQNPGTYKLEFEKYFYAVYLKNLADASKRAETETLLGSLTDFAQSAQKNHGDDRPASLLRQYAGMTGAAVENDVEAYDGVWKYYSASDAEIPEAEKIFERVVARDAKHPVARAGLIKIYLSYMAQSRADGENPETTEAWLTRATAQEATGGTQNEKHWLARSAMGMLRRAQAKRTANSRERNGLMRAAVDAFQEAIRAGSPFEHMEWNNIGLCWMDSGEYETALEALFRSHALAPYSHPNLLALGDLFFAIGNPRAAARYYRDAGQINPNDPESFVKIWSSMLYTNAAGDALALLNNWAETLPNQPYIPFALGVYFARGGNWTMAANWFEECLDMDAHWDEARCNLAYCQFKSGETEDALITYEEVLDSNPRSLPALAGRAEIFEALRKPVDAAENWRAVLVLDPYHVTAIRRVAGLELSGGNADAAESLYKNLLSGTPDDARVYHEVIQALENAGQNTKAEKWVAEAAGKFPDDGDLQYRLGLIWLGKKEWEKSIDVLLQCLQKGPKAAQVYPVLAEAYLEAGRYRECINTSQKIIDWQGPDHPDSQRATDNIAEATRRLRERMDPPPTPRQSSPLSWIPLATALAVLFAAFLILRRKK